MPQPKIRAQSDEIAGIHMPLPPLQIPSPRELDIDSRTSAIEVDWADVRRRLQQLQVTSFHAQKLADGGFRFGCVVPTATGPKKVEAEAVTEVDAINWALSHAERLK